jgi:xanthine dehydrogenase accessory factor
MRPERTGPGPDLALIGGMPDDAVREYADDPQAVVITLTHDPRIDDMALMEALESKAWYVGALGSLKTTAARKERLQMLGVHSCCYRSSARTGRAGYR